MRHRHRAVMWVRGARRGCAAHAGAADGGVLAVSERSARSSRRSAVRAGVRAGARAVALGRVDRRGLRVARTHRLAPGGPEGRYGGRRRVRGQPSMEQRPLAVIGVRRRLALVGGADGRRAVVVTRLVVAVRRCARGRAVRVVRLVVDRVQRRRDLEAAAPHQERQQGGDRPPGPARAEARRMRSSCASCASHGALERTPERERGQRRWSATQPRHPCTMAPWIVAARGEMPPAQGAGAGSGTGSGRWTNAKRRIQSARRSAMARCCSCTSGGGLT
jgi:hypothetical protein